MNAIFGNGVKGGAVHEWKRHVEHISQGVMHKKAFTLLSLTNNSKDDAFGHELTTPVP